MAKENTQAKTNPYPNSDSNKRYYAYEYYLRKTFGGRVAKLALDGGFTCPNIDGRCGTGGCIYCSGNGSGDFTAPATLPVREQMEAQRKMLSGKWQFACVIPYFQAHTGTYAPLDRLRALYEEALAAPDAVGLNIATRADCLADDVLAYLGELSERTVLTVELGLQTAHDKTAAAINRGHDLVAFLSGYRRLREAAPRARICVHLIFGLPDESEEMMLQTVRQVAALAPDEVKLHLLYVLLDAPIADLYLNGAYQPMEKDDYVRVVARALELLPPHTVIGRLTGDAPAGQLLAPLWSRYKIDVLNSIDTYLFEHNTWQGRLLGS